ncbi:hypothetical protein PAXRUDRAFT_30667 [Paxillus rubicundulus Ve08.2h10]|uniref:Unplaced genomic scaffold scaffold_45, whole genome shotgun sequence n=1 Tax=Paxillus rubicundulus Ve08.2h10 TaxID=930991 RepID=A0A0D0DVV6_9AGAM|nr:hypothetical protein PAXRUDRAFT_30667 [Paxillus rubicundulus Ve08.2h10]
MPRLRVLAGPTIETLVPITDLVNSGRAHIISSDWFEGRIAVYVKNFIGPEGRHLTSEYFEREDRKSITWSIQVQGRFLQSYPANNILFGNIFDKPLKLPWGSSAALTFMQFIDPTLEHNLTSTSKPWALSPLIATMPHFAHRRIRDPHETLLSEESEPFQSPFPPTTSISDDTSQLWFASTSSSIPQSGSQTPSETLSSTSLSNSSSSNSDVSHGSARSSLRKNVEKTLKKSLGRTNTRRKGAKKDMDFQTPSERRSYFRNTQNRLDVLLGPEDLITVDFCYGYLEFSPTLALRLPGGISFDLVRYWDKHPVRFICCERKKLSPGREDVEQPIGKIFWCVSFEEGDNDEPGRKNDNTDTIVRDNTRDVD